MRLQRFERAHEWNIIGEIDIQKDQFARYYADGSRVALVRPEGIFTTLICADGQFYYIMTSDWAEAQRLGVTRQASQDED